MFGSTLVLQINKYCMCGYFSNISENFCHVPLNLSNKVVKCKVGHSSLSSIWTCIQSKQRQSKTKHPPGDSPQVMSQELFRPQIAVFGVSVHLIRPVDQLLEEQGQGFGSGFEPDQAQQTSTNY